MGNPVVEEILAVAGQPVSGHTLGDAELVRAAREGRVVEIYSPGASGKGASFESMTTLASDDEGRVRGAYLVFPRWLPGTLRRPSPAGCESVDEAYAAFGVGDGRPGSIRAREAPPHHGCGICSRLAAYERGFQRGREDDAFLPAAADSLELVRNLKPGGGSRLLQLKRCPECGTHYLYRTDYEFLYGGSEDEQELTRLTPEEAGEYLRRPEPEPGWFARFVDDVVSRDG